MTKTLILLVAVGACANQTPSTPLAKLQTTYGDTKIEVVAKAQLNIELHIDTKDGECPLLGSDVTAQFDGAAMSVSRGGYDTDSSGCYPIAFWTDQLPADEVAAFEKTTNGSELIVKDKSAAWGINTTKLFADDFVDDKLNSQVLWEDVASITSAQLFPAVDVQLVGNAIHYPKGTAVESVDALAHPTPTRCDGPQVCTVSLEGNRQLAPITP